MQGHQTVSKTCRKGSLPIITQHYEQLRCAHAKRDRDTPGQTSAKVQSLASTCMLPIRSPSSPDSLIIQNIRSLWRNDSGTSFFFAFLMNQTKKTSKSKQQGEVKSFFLDSLHDWQANFKRARRPRNYQNKPCVNPAASKLSVIVDWLSVSMHGSIKVQSFTWLQRDQNDLRIFGPENETDCSLMSQRVKWLHIALAADFSSNQCLGYHPKNVFRAFPYKS